MEIKRWDTGAVIISGDESSLFELVLRAVKEKKCLERANLQGANLQGANLQRAYLRGADLRGADLQGAYLRGADLRGADLQRADLRGADLQRADLRGADLQGAYLRGAKNIPLNKIFGFSIVPEVGSFTAFKKVRADSDEPFIAELIVPSDAKRLGGLVGRKCRVSAARVIDVKTLSGQPTEIKKFRSGHDSEFIYRVGDLVEPKEAFCDDMTEECVSGIHCFITRKEAEQY